jgi:hypothetical protein
MQPTTVFTTFSYPTAQLVRSQLEAAGFHPFVLNENASITLGGFSKSTIISVQVPESEAAAAREFLGTPATPAE